MDINLSPENRPKRRAAIILAAIILLLMSVAMLALAVLVGVGFAMMPMPPTDTAGNIPPSFLKAFMVIGVAVIVVPAMWGIITAIGLFRRREWARISTIVIGAISASFAVCSAVFVALMPLPAPAQGPVDATILRDVRFGLGGFYLAVAAVGVWWIVLFTRRSVRAQFASARRNVNVPFSLPQQTEDRLQMAGMPLRRARPVAVSIIAWFLIGTAALFPLNILFHAPVVMLGKVFVGSIAVAITVLFAAGNVALGIGLLRRNDAARKLTIAFLLFGIVNSLVAFLAPGREARIAALLQAQPAFVRDINQQTAFNPSPLMLVGVVFGAVIATVAIWALIKAKLSFVDA